MKPVEEKLTRFVRGRIFVALMSAAGIILVMSGIALQPADRMVTDGFAGRFHALTMSSGGLVSVVSLAIMAAVVFLMLLANRFFNILRTSSRLYAGLFLFMAAAVPGATGMALDGLLLTLVIILSLVIMYTTYQRSLPTRRIFLVFVLLSCGACRQWAYAAFIPVMLLGCAQMRCLSFRSVLAAGVGVVTPVWILWGFGLLDIEAVSPVRVAWPTVRVLSAFSPAALLAVFATVATAVVTTLYNTVRVFGLNAQTRAFNGIFASLTLWTALLTILDLGHAVTYMPLLAALTAMQATLFFRIGIERRSYIGVLVLIAIFVGVVCLQLS